MSLFRCKYCRSD